MDPRLLAPAGLVLLLALGLPPAAAQGETEVFEVHLVAPAAPIKPVVETPTFSVQVRVSCDLVLPRVVPTSPDDPVVVQLTFKMQSGVVISGPPTIPLDPVACLAGATRALEGTSAFQVSVPRTAPGLQAIPGLVEARLPPSQVASGKDHVLMPFTVTADAYIVSQAKLGRKLVQCEDGRASFDVEVTNYGNVRTVYTFELADEPGEGWTTTLPQPLVLDTANSDPAASNGTVTFVVQCPLGNSKGSYEVVVHPAAAEDPTKTGNDLTIQFQAAERLLPSPVAALLAVGLLAAALVARRRA